MPEQKILGYNASCQQTRQRKIVIISLHATKKSETKQKIGRIPAFRRATETTLRPLIFVPGIMASALARRVNNTTTNVDGEHLEYFWPPPYNLSMRNREERMLNGLQSDIRSNPSDKTSVEAVGLYPLTYDCLINAI
jgi:hypothetical protein